MKSDKSIEDLKLFTAKYLKIAGEGNQSIAGTLTKFIGEIEYLFINAIKIEYNYYIKKSKRVRNKWPYEEQMRPEAKNANPLN